MTCSINSHEGTARFPRTLSQTTSPTGAPGPWPDYPRLTGAQDTALPPSEPQVPTHEM